jgi:NAD+ synthase (glutamine-hydrolysing)
MKIALAQLNYRIGDFEQNESGIIACIQKARNAGADLVVFAELSVCGYPPRDFLEFDDFIEKCYTGVLRIAEECTGIAAIVGSPSVNPADKGKPLYNSAYFLADGRIQSLSHKTLLPNYDVFDEYRYFEPNRLPYEVIEYKGSRIALTICEDLWNITDDPLYVRNPMDELAKLNPDMIINIAASPFHYSQPANRFEVLKRNAMTYGIPVFYVNQVGGHTELLFDGGSMVINAGGELVAELKRFSEDFLILDTVNLEFENRFTDHDSRFTDHESRISLIHNGLVMGIRDYFHKMGFSKAILGLSGGIDSAVTLVLAAEALGKENVKAVLLPSKFSSDHSIKDALDLANNLGVEHEIIPIEESFTAIQHSLEQQFRDQPFNLTEENIQARVRAVILMALSNKFGFILLNTSNKSEAAVGYGTLYGDMCGGLSVLGDVYKTQVYELARYINREKEIIPQNSIDKPPSAELRPDQKDSDSLPEYDILDKILLKYIEERKGPRELILAGFDEIIVKRILKLVNTNEYKRYQTPPILRVSPKAFGMGRRMPIVGKYLS